MEKKLNSNVGSEGRGLLKRVAKSKFRGFIRFLEKSTRSKFLSEYILDLTM